MDVPGNSLMIPNADSPTPEPILSTPGKGDDLWTKTFPGMKGSLPGKYNINSHNCCNWVIAMFLSTMGRDIKGLVRVGSTGVGGGGAGAGVFLPQAIADFIDNDQADGSVLFHRVSTGRGGVQYWVLPRVYVPVAVLELSMACLGVAVAVVQRAGYGG